MATDINKFQTKEVLNRVLNSDLDALKVDIDNVTLTTEGADVAIDVALDNANDSVLIYSNTVKDGSGTNYVPLVDLEGHLQVDALSSALPSGAATAANQVTIIGHLDGVEGFLTDIETNTDYGAVTGGGVEASALRVTIANDSTGVLSVDDGGGSITIDGTVTANLSATDNAVLDSIDSDTTAIKTAVETIDNAISGNEMQVDIVADGAGLATSANQSTTNTHLANMLYGTGLDIDIDAGDHALGSTFQSLFVGVGGNIVVTLATSGSDFTFKNVASGQLLPIQITHVRQSGTTATDMIAMKA